MSTVSGEPAGGNEAPPFWQHGNTEGEAEAASEEATSSATQRDMNEAMRHMSFEKHGRQDSTEPYTFNYTWQPPQQHGDDHHQDAQFSQDGHDLLSQQRSLEERLDNLQGKVEEEFKFRESGHVATTLEELQRELDNAKTEMQQSIQQHRQKMKTLERQHKGEIENLKQQANEQGWRLSQSEQQSKAQAQQIQSQSEQLHMHSQQQRAFDGALRSFQNQLQQQRSEIEDLRSQRPLSDRTRQGSQPADTQLTTRIGKIESQLRETRQPPDYNLTSRLDRIERSQQQPPAANLNNRMAKLEGSHRDLLGWMQQQKETHEKDIRSLRGRHQRLEEDLQHTEDDIDSLERNVDGLRKENDKLKRSKSAQNVPTLGMFEPKLSPTWKADPTPSNKNKPAGWGWGNNWDKKSNVPQREPVAREPLTRKPLGRTQSQRQQRGKPRPF